MEERRKRMKYENPKCIAHGLEKGMWRKVDMKIVCEYTYIRIYPYILIRRFQRRLPKDTRNSKSKKTLGLVGWEAQLYLTHKSFLENGQTARSKKLGLCRQRQERWRRVGG